MEPMELNRVSEVSDAGDLPVIISPLGWFFAHPPGGPGSVRNDRNHHTKDRDSQPPQPKKSKCNRMAPKTPKKLLRLNLKGQRIGTPAFPVNLLNPEVNPGAKAD